MGISNRSPAFRICHFLQGIWLIGNDFNICSVPIPPWLAPVTYCTVVFWSLEMVPDGELHGDFLHQVWLPYWAGDLTKETYHAHIPWKRGIRSWFFNVSSMWKILLCPISCDHMVPSVSWTRPSTNHPATWVPVKVSFDPGPRMNIIYRYLQELCQRQTHNFRISELLLHPHDGSRFWD